MLTFVEVPDIRTYSPKRKAVFLINAIRKNQRHVPVMSALLIALAIFLCAGAATSEVSDNFNNCLTFFYQRTPPVISYPGELREKSICQEYSNGYRFATLYSKRYRIPVYSAYDLPLGDCPAGQPKRRDNWFIEPQLLENGGQEPRNMKTPGTRKNEYKVNQAIDDDYRNTGFDRGHLNPSFYHCGDARTATFTLTNAVPQDACFNQQIWFAMESKSKQIMDDLCSFGGAKRFFVTGTIPYRRLIPNREHDLEGDTTRDYNRVSVPSHMWTAACCDSTASTNPADRSKGFSFGYLGENNANGSVKVSSVRQLENSISSIPPEGRSVRIFAGNDYCNENSDNSKTALEKIQAVVVKDAVNSQDKLSMTDLSQLPFKKRRLDISDIQNVNSLGKKVLFDFTVGVELRNNAQDVNTFRDQLKSKTDLTVIMTGFNSIKTSQIKNIEFDEKSRTSGKSHKNKAITTRGSPKIDSGYKKNHALNDAKKPDKIIHSGRKVKFDNPKVMNKKRNIHKENSLPKKELMHIPLFKSLNKKRIKGSTRFSKKQDEAHQDDPLIVVDSYVIASKLSSTNNMTVGGDFCKSDNVCDYHDYKYTWCYTDTTWDYCCIEDCKSDDLKTSIPKCNNGNFNSDCSMRSSVITVTGGRCRENHECGFHTQGYYWCYTDFYDNWEYCCRPWHRCDKYGEDYKWCYTGKAVDSGKWRHCYY